MPKKKNENKSIFVSSTFRDMQAERDALRDYVLPRVNEFAAGYGRAAELIDLRWGVDTAGISPEEQNRKVLRTCLDEIKRSRPFFIGILGDRYGWVPPEEVMSDALNAAEYEASTFNQSVTALEIEYGALRPSEPPVCLFYFRHIADYSSLDMNAQADYIDKGKSRERLYELKKEIADKFGSSVKEYEAMIEKGEVTGLSAFADMVAEDIKNALRAEWGESPAHPPGEDEQEATTLENYRLNKTEGFAGRGGVIRKLTDFCLGGGDGQILIVQGEPGSGKSALMCKVMDEIEAKTEKRKDFLLLPFACGITPRASRAEGLLRSFIWRLETRLGSERGEYSGFDELKDRFFELLHAAEDFRVVAVVDALDQLNGGAEARNMLWISGRLPDNFRLLCSIIDGPETAAAENMGGKIYPIPEMSGKEMGKIIRAIADKHHKQLSDVVVRYILMKLVPCASGVRQAAQNPLYLNLLIQNLAMMDRYEHAVIDKYAAETDSKGKKVRTPMEAINLFMKERITETPPDPEGAFMSIAERVGKLIDGDIGKDFVMPVLCMIAASRGGLREIDLEGAFKQMGQGFGSADFSWLRQMLRGLFTQGDAMQWNFAHESLRRALWRTYKNKLLIYNQSVARYFYENAGDDRFIHREIIHHLYLMDRADMAAELIISQKDNFDLVDAYGDGLVDAYARQSGADEGDFLFEVLDAAEKNFSEDIGWTVAAAYFHCVSHKLPYGTPRNYGIKLLKKALKLAQKVQDKHEDARKIALYLTTLLGAYVGREHGEKDALVHLYKAVETGREIFDSSKSPEDLISLVHALSSNVAHLQNIPEAADELREKRIQLEEYCRSLLQAMNDGTLRELIPDVEERDGSVAEMSVGFLRVLEAMRDDPEISVAELAVKSYDYIEFTNDIIELMKEQSGVGSTFLYYRNMHSAYNMLGALYHKIEKYDKAISVYQAGLDARKTAYEITGDIRDVEHIIPNYMQLANEYAACKDHHKSFGLCGEAHILSENLFREYPSIENAVRLAESLVYYVHSHIPADKSSEMRKHAVRLLALYTVLDKRGALADAGERMKIARNYASYDPPEDDKDGAKAQKLCNAMVSELESLLPPAKNE